MTVLALAVLASVTFWLTTATFFGSQASLQPQYDPKIEVREATPEDAAIISNITIEAFKELAGFRYVRQFFDQYPHDAYNCLKGEAERGLARPNVTGHIAFVPANEPPHAMTAVSAGLWILPEAMRFTRAASTESGPVDAIAMPFLSLLMGTEQACHTRDINWTRGFDYARQSSYLLQRYLDDVYPEEQQFYLASIATLPAYQGHDFAGQVLRKGLDIVNHIPAHRLPSTLYATLAATPAGEPLYWENGYQSTKNITIHALDTEETFRFDIMVKQLRP